MVHNLKNDSGPTTLATAFAGDAGKPNPRDNLKESGRCDRY